MVCLSVSLVCLFFFFFKQKTAYEMRISDWSSDVCSSDLTAATPMGRRAARATCAAPTSIAAKCAAPTERRYRRGGSSERGRQHTPRGDPAAQRNRAEHRFGGGLPSRRRVRQSGRASCRERGCQYG